TRRRGNVQSGADRSAPGARTITESRSCARTLCRPYEKRRPSFDERLFVAQAFGLVTRPLLDLDARALTGADAGGGVIRTRVGVAVFDVAEDHLVKALLAPGHCAARVRVGRVLGRVVPGLVVGDYRTGRQELGLLQVIG